MRGKSQKHEKTRAKIPRLRSPYVHIPPKCEWTTSQNAAVNNVVF